MKKTVLLIEPTIRPIGVEYLQRHFEVILAPDGEEETMISFINEHQAKVVIVRSEKVSRQVFEQCPSLLVVGMHGVGVDGIDMESATRHGVMVVNAPLSNYTSVAEHSIMSILALSRNLKVSDAKVRANEWAYRETFYPMEICHKTLLIVGMGRVGQELASKAKAFNMRVLGYDPFVTKGEMRQYGVEKVEELDAALPACDFVSLHAPLTKQTFHLFSVRQFEAMKETAYIVNLGRGALIDEAALYEALIRRKIAGAALDVLEREPPNPGNPLFELANVIFTPHFAGDTLEAKDRCSETIAEEVGKVLNGNLPKNLVNPHVLKNARIYQNQGKREKV